MVADKVSWAKTPSGQHVSFLPGSAKHTAQMKANIRAGKLSQKQIGALRDRVHAGRGINPKELGPSGKPVRRVSTTQDYTLADVNLSGIRNRRSKKLFEGAVKSFKKQNEAAAEGGSLSKEFNRVKNLNRAAQEGLIPSELAQNPRVSRGLGSRSQVKRFRRRKR